MTSRPQHHQSSMGQQQAYPDSDDSSTSYCSTGSEDDQQFRRPQHAMNLQQQQQQQQQQQRQSTIGGAVLQQENESLRLQIKQQQEQLRLLEEQLRLASMDETLSRRNCSFPTMPPPLPPPSTAYALGSALQQHHHGNLKRSRSLTKGTPPPPSSSSSSPSHVPSLLHPPYKTSKRRGQRPKKAISTTTTASATSSSGVHFCEDVFCYANPRDFEEILSSWYSKDELAIFKGERKELIRELKRVNFDLDRIDRSKFHLRGLEPYLSIKYNKYMQKKRAAVLQTVMLEQKNQTSKGLMDPEALREASSEASAWARERAADLGRRDAKAVGTFSSGSLSASNHAAVTTKAGLQAGHWGHESDISSAPSLCSTTSGSVSTHSSITLGNESFDSLKLHSPSMRARMQHASTQPMQQHKRTLLESVQELSQTLPFQEALASCNSSSSSSCSVETHSS